MMLEDEVASLRAENAVLREQLTATLARIAELEQQRPDPPGLTHYESTVKYATIRIV